MFIANNSYVPFTLDVAGDSVSYSIFHNFGEGQVHH